ncbi:INP53 Polyphosphatidylinositol phosphatase INP53 [Candida maltosa Xu316]
MRLLYKEEPRTLVLYSETYSLTFRINSPSDPQKPTVNLELVPNTSITKERGYRSLLRKDVFGCLGLISVESQIYLAVITGAFTKVASPLENETVDKIYAVDFISLNNGDWDFVDLDSSGYPVVSTEEADDYARVQHPCFELRKLLSNGSFYYSNDFDLTSVLQNRGVSEATNTIDHYQPQYMWNSFLMDELIQFRSHLDNHNQLILDDNRFLTTVIRGFAKTLPIGNHGDSLTIISKQSWKRAGTRYITRGIDDNGNVANFVETEYIYYNPSKSSIFTFTQIRGSVPTFWEQDSSLMNPKITLTRSLEATQPVFNKHFSDVLESYGVCHIVDLLSKTKSAEVQLSQRYQQLYSRSNKKEELEYTAFDFHQETKAAGGFSGATKILTLLHDSLQQFGWFTYDMDAEEVITRQDGVFRVNCLDCLDRTNLIEQVICRTVLENILNNQGVNRSMAVASLMQLHNTLWADNGDAISQIYTGTNALKSSFSRSGKMNIAGALSDVSKSVSRMYQNTFVDGKKQSTIDILLGVDGRNSRKVKIFNPASEFVTQQLKQKAGSFTSFENIKIFTGTYNVNALEPTQRVDLTSWLFPPENIDALPDIYAIGFQELIELNASSILNADGSKASRWSQILNEQLNSQKEQYALLRTESIASMSLFLYVKKSQVSNVTRVAGSSKKTGLGGMSANKGACAVRFEFGSTSFALVTSHLAAGTLALNERFNDYSTIMQGLVFTRNYTIKDHNHVIWFGDLNYRIDLPNVECRQLVEDGAFDELIIHDQLTLERRDKGAFAEFNEGSVKFYPTYKFDKGTSDYDTSEKQRIPSWTDRVLYMSEKSKRYDLKQLNYHSVMDMDLSDHKPVYSTFDCKVEFVDKEKKHTIAKSLYLGYRQEHGSQFDLVSLNTLSPTPSSSTSKTTRPNPNGNPPRRVPPPPASRRVTSNSSSVESAPTSPTAPKPKPPPPRKANTTISPTPMKVPFGFTSTPLIPSPSPSNSNRSSPGPSIKPTPASSAPALAPKPKPESGSVSLPSTGITKQISQNEPTEKQEEKKHHDVKPTVPKKPQALKMSDWQPLVPK